MKREPYLVRWRSETLTQRWSLYLSLGDRATARKVLASFAAMSLTDALREAALFSMDAHFEEAFASLDRHCDALPAQSDTGSSRRQGSH